jgi:NADPH:quinone reductase-like Zn-dependent oxidoreductase
VFVQGGGSSVGLAAIQLATAWGAEVHARCGAASMARARAAGASATHDRHRAPPAALQGHFDRVLVCAEPDDEAALIALLKPHAGAMLVSVVHPTLALADTLGPVRGLLAARRERRRRGAAAAAQGRAYRWCVMSIEPQAVALMAALLQQGRLRAHVGLRFDAAQLPQALQAVAEGRAGGRAVLNFP